MNKIFISHSSKDKDLVDFFVLLLEDYLHIDSDDIFCTLRTNSIVAGSDFITNIRDNLTDAKIVFFLITSNYIESKFCLMEMGAAWALKNNIVPIIVPPLNFDALSDTPLRSIQSIMLTNESSLIENLYLKKLVNDNIINRLNPTKERQFADFVPVFVEKIRIISTYNYGADINQSDMLAFAQNGDPYAIRIERKYNTYTLKCNFEPNKYYPMINSFVGAALQFSPHKNWSDILPSSSIKLECRSKDSSIDNVIMEIKSGNNTFKAFEITIPLSPEFKTVSIPINTSKISEQYLKDISELCFVVRPYFVPNFKGELEIKNIGIR